VKKLLFIPLFAFFLQAQPVHASEYPWKTQPPFEISFIDGFQDIYNPGEQFSFYVEGKSSHIDMGPKSGFSVTAYIQDQQNVTIGHAVGKYDANRSAWLINLAAPSDDTRAYNVMIYLYCGKDDSQCADTYGRAAQTEKILQLKVR